MGQKVKGLLCVCPMACEQRVYINFILRGGRRRTSPQFTEVDALLVSNRVIV